MIGLALLAGGARAVGAAQRRRRRRRDRRRQGRERAARLAVAAVRAGGRRRRAIFRPADRATASRWRRAGRLDGADAARHRRRLPLGQAADGGVNSWQLWVYLQTTPLFWLTATLGAFLVADALSQARPPPSARQSRADRRGAGRGAAEALRHALQDLFRRRAIRAFPAGAGDGGARRAALQEFRAGAAQPAADGGGAGRRRAGRHRLLGGDRRAGSARRARR